MREALDRAMLEAPSSDTQEASMSRHGFFAPLAGSAIFNTLAFGSLALFARRRGAHKHPHAEA